MLLPSVLSMMVVVTSTTPLLKTQEQYPEYEHVEEQRQFDIQDSETDPEYLEDEVDERLLTSGTAGLIADPKGITYKTAGTSDSNSSFSLSGCLQLFPSMLKPRHSLNK